METFKIKGEYIHLNQLIKAIGWCANGGEANNAIETRHVKVNGEIEIRKRNKIRIGDKIEFHNQTVMIE